MAKTFIPEVMVCHSGSKRRCRWHPWCGPPATPRFFLFTGNPSFTLSSVDTNSETHWIKQVSLTGRLQSAIQLRKNSQTLMR